MSNRDMHLVRLGGGRCGHPGAEMWADVRKRPVESSTHSREREDAARKSCSHVADSDYCSLGASIDAIACSALLQGQHSCIGCFVESKPLGVEATLPMEAPRRLESATRRLEQARPCSGCGQMCTTDASPYVCVHMQRCEERIPGSYMSTRHLYALGDNKAYFAHRSETAVHTLQLLPQP
jgi:hypothetical protein